MLAWMFCCSAFWHLELTCLMSGFLFKGWAQAGLFSECFQPQFSPVTLILLVSVERKWRRISAWGTRRTTSCRRYQTLNQNNFLELLLKEWDFSGRWGACFEAWTQACVELACIVILQIWKQLFHACTENTCETWPEGQILATPPWGCDGRGPG